MLEKQSFTELKFTIIPDSFKNCLSAKEVGYFISEGIKEIFPEAKNKVIPMADGGEGTVDVIISALGGKIVNVRVHDPLMRMIDSFFGILPDGKTAIIEMAAASGIELVLSSELNPMKTTSYGTGELIKEALNNGCTDIIIGIGGSATNDGGVGMAMALGAQFLNKQGGQVEKGGIGLNSIVKVDLKNIDSRIAKTNIKVAYDVNNTLCGEYGASVVFGPQKGATSEMVDLLDKGLLNLSKCIKSNLRTNVLNIQGGGASGGLGAGLVAFLNAKLVPGFYLIANLLNLDYEVKASDFIISAEGAIDYQTQFGKTVTGVSAIAKKYKKPLYVFVGSASEDASKLDSNISSAIIPIIRRPVTLNEAIKLAPVWLKQAGKELSLIIKSVLFYSNNK